MKSASHNKLPDLWT